MESVPQQMRALTTVTDGKNIREGSSINEVVKIHQERVQEMQGFETLVQVRYVGVSPADVTCLNIQHKNTTPGFELSGVVVEDNSGRWNKGDEVFGIVYGGLGSTLKDERLRKAREDNGAFAEFAVVHSDLLCRVPQGVSLPQAAGLPYAYLVAYQAFEFTKWPAKQAEKHEPILICGGSTMVGLAAIAIAHQLGHRVLCTTSPDHYALCKSFGADECYNFKDDNAYSKIQDDTSNDLQFAIDAICMGNSTTTAYKSLGSSAGKIVTVLPRNQTELGTRSNITIEMKLLTTVWGHEAVWNDIDFRPSSNEHQNAKAFFADLGKYVGEGKYKHIPIKVHANHGLDGVLESLEQVRKAHTSGYRLIACVKEH